MSTHTKAHLALLGTNLFFAINYNAIKYFTIHHLIGPYGLNFIRVGVCVILFWILFLFKPIKNRISMKELWIIALCAVAAIAFNQMLFIKGLSYTSPIHASLLTLLTPILITLLASILLHEKWSGTKITGLLLALCGASLLLSGKKSIVGQHILLGDLLILSSSVAYTAYFLLVKPLMKAHSPVMITRMIFTFGAFMIWPISAHEFSVIPWGDFGLIEWLLLAMIVVPGTFLAYLFNLYGIQKLSTSTAGVYIYTQPLFAGVLSMLFLGEQLTALKIAATGLIFTGLYLSGRTFKKLHTP